MTARYHFARAFADVFGLGAARWIRRSHAAEALRHAGYRRSFSASGTSRRRPALPEAQGFDGSPRSHRPGAGRNTFDPDGSQRPAEEVSPATAWTSSPSSLEFMRHNRTQPFFLYLAANLIHVPLQVATSLPRRLWRLGLDAPRKRMACSRAWTTASAAVRATLKELGLEDNTLDIPLPKRPCPVRVRPTVSCRVCHRPESHRL